MNILHQINRACERHGIPPTRFGRMVAHDPRLVFDMRGGRLPRPATVAKIQAAILTLDAGGLTCALTASR